jgi:sulfate adenylyltransferase subunit 1 (EFTu-like GTPase family)
MPHTQHPIELLRFNTCGSVDDGKSTLTGRIAALEKFWQVGEHQP